MIRPLLVSSGEPAGVGPEICLQLASLDIPVVVAGDKSVLSERADKLNKSIEFIDYQPGMPIKKTRSGLSVLNIDCSNDVEPGVLNVKNADYVLRLLERSIDLCLAHQFSGLVTAPIHKGVINQAGVSFTGHTEFLAQRCKVDSVVMMLACQQFKVALVTTHLPLKDVAKQITKQSIESVVRCLHASLKSDFNITNPKIAVAGLNPHAGESGYLGREEIDIISPSIEELKLSGIDLIGPLPADTMFTPTYLKSCDAFVAMYHDQGLPVIKYAGFGNAVNVTLGLPIIRTSVDHGTALDIAGTGEADAGSLIAAVNLAQDMARNRE
jgi:4-hydroxythreonine-4-phosphate dehydrogenase